MAVPTVIPIARIPVHRTEFDGTWSRGQFLGNVLSQTDPVAWADGDRANSRRWYAYLHEFDHEGNYLESTVESPGRASTHRGTAPTTRNGH
jgi:formate hydrogenlyase regulatory protein HycA